MPFAEFLDCRERIARARAHQRQLVHLWEEFVSDAPYTSGVRVQDDGSGEIWVAMQYDCLPKIFALLFGEMIYHLRAALDSCVYGSAIRDNNGKNPPPKEQDLEFPIRPTLKRFEDAKYRIEPLEPMRKEIIKSVQPFNIHEVPANQRWVNVHIGVLNELARKDRHRRLQFVGSYVSKTCPQLRVPSGVHVTAWEVENRGFLIGKAQVARFTLQGWSPSMAISANPNCAIDISLNEVVPGYRGTYSLNQLVPQLIEAVEQVCTRLEESF